MKKKTKYVKMAKVTVNDYNVDDSNDRTMIKKNKNGDKNKDKEIAAPLKKTFPRK